MAAPKRTEIQEASSSFQGCAGGGADCASSAGRTPGDRQETGTRGRSESQKRSTRAPPAHAAYFSNEKICFQSFFMLMTVQPFFFASS